MASLTTLGASWSVLHRPSEGTDTGDTDRESQASTVPPVMYNMYNIIYIRVYEICIGKVFSVLCTVSINEEEGDGVPEQPVPAV